MEEMLKTFTLPEMMAKLAELKIQLEELNGLIEIKTSVAGAAFLAVPEGWRPQEESLVSIADAAKRLKVNRLRIKNYIDAGLLEAVRTPPVSDLKITNSSLNRFIATLPRVNAKALEGRAA